MERRKFFRLEKTLPVKFDLPEAPEQIHTFEALSRNISEGGVFIETDLVQEEDFSLIKDTILDLEIELLGSDERIRPKGRVVWISKKSRFPRRKRGGFGVKFIWINAEEKRAVSLFISRERLSQSELIEKEIPVISRQQKLTDRQRRNLEILDTIRKSRLISRTEISKLTNINIVTVSNYIDTYLKKGLAFEKGLDISTGGRRPELVELNPDYGYVIGVDLGLLDAGYAKIKVIAADFTSRVKSKAEAERQDENIGNHLEILKRLIEEVCESSRVEKERIRGIGLGIAGIMDKFSGTVCNPLTGSTCANYITIKRELEDEFNLPVFIESSATCALFAEKWVGLSPEAKVADNIIYIFSNNQCAKMFGGELYAGSNKSAGQLNLALSQESSILDYCWANPSYDCILRMQTKSLDALTEEERLALGAKLGIKIAFLINVFNPQVVIIGEYFRPLGDIFLDTIRRTVRNWALRESFQHVRIIPATLGDEAVAVGVASLVIESLFANI